MLEEEAQQIIVGLVPPAQNALATHDRGGGALQCAFEGAILKPGDAPLDRGIPGGGEALRAGPVAQLVERLHALADMARGLLDYAGRGEMGNKGALFVQA